jgi:hypothetical protein
VISRVFGDRRRIAALRRIDRPAAALLAVLQAVVAAAGWLLNEPVWLAVVIALQLVLGSIGAVWVMGPAHGHLGLARYAVPAMAGIAATLFGRLIPGGLAILLVPIVAVLLWSVTYLELRAERGAGGRTMRDLLLTLIVFGGVAGIFGLFGLRTWPTPLGLVALLVLPAAIRSSELRGAIGAEGVGQGLVHVLAVVQVGAAALLLNLSIVATSALIALTFYTWAGAADALGQGSSGRSVAVEFGVLVLIGLVVGLILSRP